MKLTCASCLLKLNLLHFNKSHKCYSICDICRTRGLDPTEFGNYRNYLYAEISELNFIGSSDFEQKHQINLSNKEKQLIESIMSSYDDASSVLKKGVLRQDLNKKIIAYEDHEIQMDDIGNFFDNLSQMGFEVSNLHNLQKIDHTSRMVIYNQYHNLCQYCGRKGYSIDHMIPVSSGGTNDLSNLTLSCQECNKLKGDMPYEWFVEFNLQVRFINQKLVIFEKKLEQLAYKKESLTRKLNAYMHREALTIDDRSDFYRQQIKNQQILLDSINKDYNSLKKIRKNYITARFQMYKLEKREQ